MSEIDYTQYDREQLLKFLKLRDRQIDNAQKAWVKAAKEAINGDLYSLKLRVAMAEEPSPKVVLS